MITGVFVDLQDVDVPKPNFFNDSSIILVALSYLAYLVVILVAEEA